MCAPPAQPSPHPHVALDAYNQLCALHHCSLQRGSRAGALSRRARGGGVCQLAGVASTKAQHDLHSLQAAPQEPGAAGCRDRQVRVPRLAGCPWAAAQGVRQRLSGPTRISHDLGQVQIVCMGRHGGTRGWHGSGRTGRKTPARTAHSAHGSASTARLRAGRRACTAYSRWCRPRQGPWGPPPPAGWGWALVFVGTSRAGYGPAAGCIPQASNKHSPSMPRRNGSKQLAAVSWPAVQGSSGHQGNICGRCRAKLGAGRRCSGGGGA